MTSSIVIGIGNPVIADDALGIAVARSLQPQLAGADGVVVTEVYNGGLQLMEAMAGFDRAFLVDAMVSGSLPGTIHRLGIEEIMTTRNSSTTHSGSLSVALGLGRMAGVNLPDIVKIWAVEAGDVSSFCERLTPEVERAIPVVAAEIMRELFGDQTAPRRPS